MRLVPTVKKYEIEEIISLLKLNLKNFRVNEENLDFVKTLIYISSLRLYRKKKQILLLL